MLRQPLPALIVLALSLGACGPGQEVKQESADLRTFDVVEEGPRDPSFAPPPPPGAEPAPPAPPAPPGQGGPVAGSTPQIAYTYSYGFRLPAEAIATVQERHLDLCERLGPARCRVVNMERGSQRGEHAGGALTLQVAAPLARQFGQQLASAATEAGADTIERGIEAEDLSRQMVDADARIRTRETLVRRLTQLLETRSGNIQQAVEAERAINQAQEELEAARGWMAEMRNRVAMSTFRISYESGAPLAGGVADPLRTAVSGMGSLFANSLAIIITVFAALLPWALLLGLLFWLARLARRRAWAGGRRHHAPPPEAEPVEPAARL